VLSEAGAILTAKRYYTSSDAYTLQQMQSPALFHGEKSGCRNANKDDSELQGVYSVQHTLKHSPHSWRETKLVLRKHVQSPCTPYPRTAALSQQLPLGTAKRGLLLSFAKEQLHPSSYTQHCNTSPIPSISSPSSLNVVIEIIR
jgi:hypothetical protein